MTDVKKTKVDQATLKKIAIESLGRLEIKGSDADAVADVLVMADMMGIHTHGVARILSYGERIKVGGINAKPDIKVRQSYPTVATMDGDNAIGPLLGSKAIFHSMEMASEFGMGMVFVNGSNHFGPIMPYSFMAAEQGYMSFIASNATTTIAPYGGTVPKLGNNPLGFGFPHPKGEHFLLDMALSTVARAKVRAARDQQKSIPLDWATDSNGIPTSDPNEALSGMLQTIGGYKGYGLALAVDMLAGVLSGAAYLNHVKAWDKQPDQPQNLGHFFLTINTKGLGENDWLGERMVDFSSIIHDTPPIDVSNPVQLPGERELRALRHHREYGVAYDTQQLRALQES
ncbi:Ldh family oxidoreductase [Salinicola sp. MIT1003]|uniref:Ldh family oxidoreductase n=1 Tax=Salinicola sp. MIT1003 TaxID=1882734 RepID=UPI0008DDF127|nr:Ldh family oxidoreductase [Salinicola sp. MIT1003]OHZ02694.1 hydroxyacid dehydrogenase [Salinicola sp. MIT1003]